VSLLSLAESNQKEPLESDLKSKLVYARHISGISEGTCITQLEGRQELSANFDGLLFN